MFFIFSSKYIYFFLVYFLNVGKNRFKFQNHCRLIVVYFLCCFDSINFSLNYWKHPLNLWAEKIRKPFISNSMSDDSIHFDVIQPERNWMGTAKFTSRVTFYRSVLSCKSKKKLNSLEAVLWNVIVSNLIQWNPMMGLSMEWNLK